MTFEIGSNIFKKSYITRLYTESSKSYTGVPLSAGGVMDYGDRFKVKNLGV